MGGRVISWGMAAGLLAATATGLLLFWASPTAAAIAGGLFVAGLMTGLLFLFRTLVGGDELKGEASAASYVRQPRS